MENYYTIYMMEENKRMKYCLSHPATDRYFNPKTEQWEQSYATYCWTSNLPMLLKKFQKEVPNVRNFDFYNLTNY